MYTYVCIYIYIYIYMGMDGVQMPGALRPNNLYYV